MYLMLFLLSACALGVDRFLVPGTATAQGGASIDAGNAAALDPVAQIESAAAATPMPELPFPRGLERFDGRNQHGTRDIFAPMRESSAGTDPGLDPSRRRSQRGAGNDLPTRASYPTFMKGHRLNGLVIHRGLIIAVVEGRWLRPGQRLDGCELLSIFENEAHFRCFDGTAILSVLDRDPFQAAKVRP